MKHSTRIGISVIIILTSIGLGRFVSACASVNPRHEADADRIIKNEPQHEFSVYRELIANYDAAVLYMDEVLDAPSPNSTDLALAQKQLDDSLAALRSHEDQRAIERGASVGGVIGTITGTGPAGDIIGGAILGQFAPALLTKRGRKLLRQAARQAGSSQPGAEGTMAIGDALVTVARAAGWGHSTPESEKVAEETLGKVAA